MPLDPYNLTPAASLNRVRLAGGERLVLPEHLDGRLARDVLSAAAVREIDGAEHGLRLACLLGTLKLGGPEARAARQEWDETYWRQWAAVERVYIAGGLASVGPAEAAEAVLRGWGVACEVRVAAYPAHAPLIGVARAIRQGAERAFVLDFGGTAVKRGIASYGPEGLTELQILPPLPSPQLSPSRSPDVVADMLVSTVEQDPAAASGALVIGVSIASYVRDGHVLEPPHAAYVDLRGIDNFAAWLASRVEARTGRPASVRLLHDGTAAALAVSPEANCAVITLGTFLGHGFAQPEAGSLAPPAPAFKLLAP